MRIRIGHTLKRTGVFVSMALALTMALTPMQATGQRTTTGLISAASAKRTALKGHPGEVVGNPKLVTRSGVQYYDVNIHSGSVKRHVLVNARTGRLLQATTKPRTRDARKIALATYPGRVVGSPRRTRYRGVSVSSVTVQSGIVRRTVLVDTESGKILKSMIRNTK
jgi:uncharacterized membrane protein YkoI